MSSSKTNRFVQVLPKELDFGDVGLNEQAHNMSFIDLKLSLFPMLMLHNSQHKIFEEVKVHE